MQKLIWAAAALLTASPCAAQTVTITGCSTVSAARVVKSKDADKLRADVACLDRALPMATDQIAAARKARTDRLAALAPVPAPTPTPALSGIVAEGDSISVFWGGSYTGIYATTHPGAAFKGVAVGGARISDTQGGNGLEQRLAADLALKPAIVTVLIGANDLGDGNYASGDAWLAALWSYVAKVKATGARVAVGTVLPQCETLSWQAETAKRLNQRRPAVNAAIRSAVGSKIDAVIDFAADHDLGPDKAACDTRWYKDGLHPTDGSATEGGEGRMFQVYAPVVDALLAWRTTAPISTPVPVPTPAPVPVPSTSAATVAPIASNFDRVAFLTTGYDPRGDGSHIPASAGPWDDQGAFRFICSAGPLVYDDPILYPGQPGKAHLHQTYGNTGMNAASTYATLRTTGDSTCSNKLNRSAYWVPALMNAAGQVIAMDYASVYYKRNPTDELCRKIATKGCADLPTGFTALSGYDPSRMGQRQPDSENRWRCATNQIWRNTIAESVADCGGEGQIVGSIVFGPCWTGERDSPDHRSHITQPAYQSDGQPHCPATHPDLIPTLTQQFFWTVKKSDGEVCLSSDRMPGMAPVPCGTTLHADYMEAWDPPTRQTWSANCIGKLLNCSDGELGDGTMLARGPLTYVAVQRLLPAPARP